MTEWSDTLLGITAKELAAIEKCMLTTFDLARLLERDELTANYLVVRDFLERAREHGGTRNRAWLESLLGESR